MPSSGHGLQTRPWRIALTLLAMCCFGCGPSESGSGSSSETAPGKPRVALIMKSLANEFFATMAEGAEAHQSEHADDYSLLVNGIKDERDLSRQVALVEEMIADGVDAIVIAPADSQALVPVLKRAQAEGIVVVNIDNRLDQDVLADEGFERQRRGCPSVGLIVRRLPGARVHVQRGAGLALRRCWRLR